MRTLKKLEETYSKALKDTITLREELARLKERKSQVEGKYIREIADNGKLKNDLARRACLAEFKLSPEWQTLVDKEIALNTAILTAEIEAKIAWVGMANIRAILEAGK